MKIERLNLKAYGHFTDVSLNFASKSPGLHIIYGPNEAGKSTCLRALRSLLFGIPARTQDDFLHEYKKMLIGGRLINSDGSVLDFFRRKRRVGDLLDADLAVLSIDVLEPFLHGIEEGLFSTLFGIDHETLVSGGRDILEQKGDVGQALFSAGAGLSSLHEIIEDLEKETANIFKPTGRTPELNQAIKVYQELKKESRNLSLSEHVWKEQERAFKDASSELVKIERERNTTNSELERLRRLQRALSKLAQRQLLLGRFFELKTVAVLPEDFSERINEARSKKTQSSVKETDASSRKEGIETKKSSYNVRQGILDQSETVDALHQRLGLQRQAQKDRPDIQADMIRYRAEAEALLNDAAPSLDISQTAEIKELLSRRQTILRQGHQHSGLKEACQQAEKRTKDLNDSIKETRHELKSIPDTPDSTGLATALNSCRKVGDLDGRIRIIEQESAVLDVSIEAAVSQLDLWQGTVTDLLSVKLPSTEVVARFIDEFKDAKSLLAEIRHKRQNLEDDRDQVQCDIATMDKAGAVCREKDLLLVRSQRDQGWSLVKRAWLHNEDVTVDIEDYCPGDKLPEAFEGSLRDSDELSDRLRTEAERVHKYAAHCAQQEKLQKQLERITSDEESAVTDFDELKASWQKCWENCQVQPLSPKEMRGWLDDCLDIRRKLKDQKEKQAQVQPLVQQRETLRQLLLKELADIAHAKNFVGDELEPVLGHAEHLFEEIEGRRETRNSLQIEIHRIEGELDKALQNQADNHGKLSAWQTAWQQVIKGLGVGENAEPEEVAGILENLQLCLEKKVKARGFDERLESINADSREFSEAVTALVQAVAPELKDMPPEQAAAQLQALLKESKTAQSLLNKANEDLENVKEDLRQAKLGLTSSEEMFADLRNLAECDSDAELESIESSFLEYQELKKELAQLEINLADISEGVALGELDRQRQEVDPDELPSQIDSLDRKLKDELEPQALVLSEKKGAARIKLEQMDGSGKAAEKEEDAQAALAKVRRLAESYVRSRLGTLLLKKEIERYRREHQDPILKIASRYFSELTLGAFIELRSDIDDSGQPILVGVGLGDNWKQVEDMSSGTRDQLYLALRLATLEWRLEKHEAMPFVADDILVNFDDQRSEATLKALAELGKKNQVVLFTHHHQIVRTVESLNMGDQVFVHPLSTAPAII